MKRLKELFWKLTITRLPYLLLCLIYSKVLWILHQYYYSAKIICINYRLLANENVSASIGGSYFLKLYKNFYIKILNDIRKYDNNIILSSYLETNEAKKYLSFFSKLEKHDRTRLRLPRPNDTPERQGDLMIVKAYNPKKSEKGVIILHYTETLAKCAATFELKKLSQYYYIVLEPSWWGYQSVYFLFYYGLDTMVFIESPYKPDYEFVADINHNFFPCRIGAGDWVDPEVFYTDSNINREYDVVMVGNWSLIKRHELLFKALEKMDDENIKVALIGYQSHGREISDIINEAKKYGVDKLIEVFEQIPPIEVANILRKSKINVLLSKGEGANRGIYEGLFSGNVIVLYEHNKGVNRSIITPDTGFLANEKNLHTILKKVLSRYDSLSPDKWAISNTGYKNATVHLNEKIKKMVSTCGDTWVEDVVPKKNIPNNIYAIEEDRKKMEKEYVNLEKCLMKTN